jgi:hypothetical protein
MFLSTLPVFAFLEFFLRLWMHHQRTAIRIAATLGTTIPIIRGSFEEWLVFLVLASVPVATAPSEPEVDALVSKVVGVDGSTVVVLSAL